jgi:hypothetical protein
LHRDLAWDVLFHTPYAPDLAPSDFHLFTHLKQFLGGTCMGSDEDMKKMVKGWFNGLAQQISTMQAYRNSSHNKTSP